MVLPLHLFLHMLRPIPFAGHAFCNITFLHHDTSLLSAAPSTSSKYLDLEYHTLLLVRGPSTCPSYDDQAGPRDIKRLLS